MSKMFDWDVKRNGEVAWIAQRKDGEAGTITTVKKMLSRNTPLMTRYSFEGKGGLANETLYSAKKLKVRDIFRLSHQMIKCRMLQSMVDLQV